MKILELEYRGPPSLGGVETLVVEISKQFKSKGHEVEIWSTDLLDFNGKRDSQPERVVDGIKVRKFRSFKIPRFPFFMYPLIYPKIVFELLKLKRDDVIVHSHSFPSFHSYLALFFHQKFRKVTITLHFDVNDLEDFTSHFFGKLTFQILRYFVNRKNVYLTAITEREKRFYVNRLGFNERKVSVIPNGVNLEEFDLIANEEILETKKQYNLEKTFNVLYAGRVAKIKGIDILIKAISKLDNTNIRLTIAGPDFGALPELQELSQKLDLADRVTFTGALERRKFCALIKSCDMLILPSFGGEAFGIVLAEAMACSKPVIGSRTGGIAEVIQEGRNGFLFDVGSVEQLSQKISL
ncbi:glycosyltransferase family 4 protein, partial [candidate division NPL-UPA2 bacterium]|nr:glycosyltransferase family 4 protein [candidate division NPL-UPA2 bacterium]